jgi:hypothetical protein
LSEILSSDVEAQAIDMLNSQADNAAPAPAEQVEAPTTTDATVESATPAEAEDTFFDPNNLPPEAIPAYKLMRAKWTQAMQETRATQKSYESLGDVERARMAVEFTQRMENDPNFQNQLYQALQQRLGVNPQAQQQTAETEYEDDETEYRLPPEWKNTMSKIEALEQRLAQKEQADMWAVEANRIAAQEMAVRKDFPDWDEEDIESVHHIAQSAQFGGDLRAAAAYQAQQEARVLQRLISRKQTAPEPALGHASAQTVQGFDSFREATEAALGIDPNDYQ